MPRKEATNEMKVSAWRNSGGSVQSDWNGIVRPIGNALCPSRHCRLTSRTLQASQYGDNSDSSWVVDHDVPLARGGSNSHNNLQAMHNYCNKVKGDS